MKPMTQIAAVVLAAGKGTRMKSEKAKVLHEALGRPIAYFPIRAALTERLHHTPDVEVRIAAEEQRQITRLRLEKLIPSSSP